MRIDASGDVPMHLNASKLVEKDLVTARVKPTTDGTVPKISFKPEKAARRRKSLEFHPQTARFDLFKEPF